MVTPSDDTKSLRTRLAPSQRTLATLLCLVLFASAIGGSVASHDVDLHEDFEDGNTRIEYSEWTGWTGDDIETQSEFQIGGSYTGYFDVPVNGDGQSALATRDVNTTAVDEVSMKVAIDNKSSAGGTRMDVRLRDTDGTELTRVEFHVDGNDHIELEDGTIIIDTFQTETVYTLTWHKWDFNNGEVNVTVSGGGEEGTTTDTFSTDFSFGEIQPVVTGQSAVDNKFWIDDVEVLTEERFKITGQVTNQDGDAIQDATINAEDSQGNTFSDDTNVTGHYELKQLANETYNVSTKAPGYLNESADVTIDGSDEQQDFQLLDKDESLQIDVRPFIEHGQSVPYTVTATYIDGGSAVREEVTADAIVTSGNTSVFTVDEVNKELVGTSDTSVNQESYVEAEWTSPNGETFTTQKNITVANKTVDNLAILPTWTRVSATLQGGTEDNPNDRTIAVVFIATAVGALLAYIATAFAGIAGIVLIVLAAWPLGHVDDGVVIAAVLMATFVGLNLAGNVDYTVRK